MTRYMGWVAPFEQSAAMNRYIEQRNCNPRKVEEYWHRAFSCVAKYLGFGRKERGVLWNELVAGNWKRLHQTEDEENWTPEMWLDALYWQVMYCSDRWSLDRLTRCHWLWRQYDKAAKKREEVSNG